jgi:putative ABC transport system permease protein
VSVTSPLHVIIAVVILAVLTTVLLSVFQGAPRWSQLWAVVRGAVQLALISLILGTVITSYVWIAAALLVMFTVAWTTATRRIGWSARHAAVMGTAMAGGALTSLLVIFGSGAVEFSPRYLLALGGIIIGGSMTVATLSARGYRQSLADHWAEVEAWLALGATEAQAVRRIARLAVANALVPNTDQAKTTGLVTLPGAFVGAIFGGLSPLQAGQFQILVLAGLLATGSITAITVVTGLRRPLRRPE